jgi:hypothetical protein
MAVLIAAEKTHRMLAELEVLTPLIKKPTIEHDPQTSIYFSNQPTPFLN